MKKTLIIIINKMIYKFGKLFKKGSSMPGKIVLKLDKNILDKIVLPKNIIAVTGSNGKTSTVEMICNILEKSGYTVGCNKEGSNQIEGVTTMILNCCNLKGVVKKDFLVIETDERYARHTFKHFKPTHLVITNLYRDQMTRNGHPEHIYNIIKEAIDDDIHLILNADDPLTSLFGYKRKNVTYFGMAKNELSKENNDSVYDDGKYCPNCKEKLDYEYYHYNHIGKYNCNNCGHKRNDPDFEITNLDFENSTIEINNKDSININLKSIYNAYNILVAFTVASLFKIDSKKITEVLNNYIIKNDRVQKFEINGHNAMLLTSKHENSISYNQSLMYVVRQNKPCSVVLIVDAISRKYFTSETSWLWDIDFELLNNDCVKKIIVSGKYVNDLSIRLQYANVNQEKIVQTGDLDKMMEYTKNDSIGDVYVITCFSDRMKFMSRR